ncbi:MAG: lipopolysaccharide kinase [Phycisphaerales bacterium]|nr:lipopolysaccharide kinase [Phycisphaerales bacterium]
MSLPFPKGFYRAEAKYADLLKRVGLFDGMSVFEHPKIEAWRSITERENCVVDAEGTRLHIKRNKPGHTGVEEEATAIRLLMDANLPTVPLVAAGRLNDGRGFLITEDLAGYQDADIAVKAGLPFETISNATADLAGRLHGAGLHHRDLYLCHFYIRLGEKNVEAKLMDAGRVKPLPSWFRKRWLVKDLAQFLYSAGPLMLDPSDADEWFKRYTSAGGVVVTTSMLGAIYRKMRAIGRHDRALRKREPTRNVSIDR